MSFGLTPLGFKRKRYAEILSEMEGNARDSFGENVNLSAISPLGIILRIVAWSMSQLWAVAEKVYNAAYVDTAEDSSLDAVGKYIGIVRVPARQAEGDVTFTGIDATVIPQGFMVETTDGVQFETSAGVTIAGSDVTAPVRALIPGVTGNVPLETITEISNPTAGVDTVVNPDPISGGRSAETDAEFRERYELSVARAGASTIDSIRASLLETEDVRAALVIENNTMDFSDPPDAGLPPKSIECLVLGGTDEDVAQTILDTKAAGIQAYGVIPVPVTDSMEQEHIIGFTRATEELIYIEVDVIAYMPAFPADGIGTIRTEVVRYIGGVDVSGNIYSGLSMGDDVIYNHVVSKCFIPGVADVVVNMATGGEFASLTTAIGGDNNDLRYEARAIGTDGNAITVTYVDPGTPDEAINVAVAGNDITVNLATDGDSDIISTATEVALAVRQDEGANLLVIVENASGSNGNGIVTAMALTNLSDGANTSALSTDNIAIATTEVAETTHRRVVVGHAT